MAQATATRRPIQDAYTRWIESVGVPIYRGHIVSDMRSAELGWWEERQCNAAFLQLDGMEGLSESRVTEIPPGKTLPPLKFALGEVVYVLEGQGLCTVWSGNGPKKTFEWQKHSMFQLPRYCYHQLTNIRGDQPARLFHYNYLAFAMTVMPDPAFFFNGDYEDESLLYGQEDAFSQAKAVLGRGASDARAEAWGATTDDSVAAARHGGVFWVGNFFPDMSAWDRLSADQERGGGTNVSIRFPGSGMAASMSVFDEGLYKKGHRHGPGFVIIIPSGEGYTLMWEEGGEKIVLPWNEATVFTPPSGWYHKHFNVGTQEARYLKWHTDHPLMRVAPRGQIEYPDEETWIREKFNEELAKRGLTSRMPDAVYTDPAFRWDYGDGD